MIGISDVAKQIGVDVHSQEFSFASFSLAALLPLV